MQLSKREKILLYVLIAIASIIIFSFVSISYFSEIISLDQKISEYKSSISKIEQKIISSRVSQEKVEELNTLIKNEKEKFYSPDVMDINKFGKEIKNSLQSFGIKIKNYKTVKDTSFIEYSVSGNPLTVINFLKKIAESEKYLTIPEIRIKRRMKSKIIELTFRIGYETIN